MKKILCLTDFSEKAYNGVLYANELAKKFSSKLIFIHTYELNENREKEALLHPSLTMYTDTESRNILNSLCTKLERENRYSPVSYEYLISEGGVSDNLNGIIREKNIDLVVFSVEGELSPHNTYYGNIVSEIVQIAQCPVIVVPSEFIYRGIQNIVYAFDIEKETTLEKSAIEFVQLFDANLNIISFSNEENDKKADAFYSKFSHLKNQSGYNKMRFDLKATNNMIHCLEEFVTDRNADLLILENHKRLLYERLSERSFTRSFVFFSKVPVLVIRSKEK